MLAEALLLAISFQVGPFYEQRPAADFRALRPFWSETADSTDVLWPVFTAHRDWWRLCWFVHEQDYPDGGYQFEIMPLWFNGRDAAADDSYWGLFPLWGRHPHALTMYDFRFCLWPLWTQYRMPRPEEDRWMTTNAVLFPFFHWRDDGSWGFWPVCGTSHNRADDHSYALWPLFNWKTSFADRDTAGAGTSWMFWPLCAHVDRERESQWMVLPPFFSHAEAPDGWQGRYPLPLVEVERRASRSRTSVFPFYEHIVNYRYYDHAETGRITRFGWRLVELLPDETRVFPFWTSRDDGYLRIWPFWESDPQEDGTLDSRFLCLFPIRWVPSVDRNWAKFWTFYERRSSAVCTEHSLLWGIFKWSTSRE